MKFNNKNKLIKVDNGYVLLVDNIMYATDNDKLSLKNCQNIERGYDLDELIEDLFGKEISSDFDYLEFDYHSFDLGFKKALELMGDKKFSDEDIKKVIFLCCNDEDSSEETIFESLQQTEWDVEIVMEPCYYDDSLGGFSSSYKEGMPTEQPKLDSNGNLILKRVNL